MISYVYVRRHWARWLVSSSGSFATGVKVRTLVFGAIATVAWFADREGFRVHLPVGLYEIAGAVIALILAFRSNTAYSRFWEGRTLWGSIVNASRNVSRIIARYAVQEPDELVTFKKWVVAFAHLSRRMLREQNVYPELESLLPQGELALLRKADHPALYASEQLSGRIAALLAKGAIDPMMAMSAEKEVRTLVDDLGGCERIHKTPTPLGYVLLIQRFVALYLVSMPFALVDKLEVFTPLVTIVVAYPVLLIEALGNELDDPFGHDTNDLPLTRICTTIQSNLLGYPPSELIHAKPGQARPGVED